jgi:hypothetical protein
MTARTFSLCLLLGWLLVTIGGVLIQPGAGLVASGVLLIVLALLAARLAGGLYVPSADDRHRAEDASTGLFEQARQQKGAA